MKFLVDAQLPPRLSRWINGKGIDSRHAMDIENGLTLPDTTLWEFARNEQEIIITKDSDFVDLALLKGSPPQIVHVQLGNVANNILIEVFDQNWDTLVTAIEGKAKVISISESQITVFE